MFKHLISIGVYIHYNQYVIEWLNNLNIFGKKTTGLQCFIRQIKQRI